MKFMDRILTIVITATLTSAAWIVFGGTWLENATERQAGTTDPEAPGGIEEEPDVAANLPATPPETATGDGTVSDVVAAGSSPAATGPRAELVIPVVGIDASQLIDSFLDARGADGSRRHEAIDIMADTGTAVVAAAPGTIAKLHQSGPGGNSVYVRSPDRLEIHYYAHLDAYASGLREGQRVRAGQRLGTVGSSGNADASAPHLHFAIMETTADAKWWEPANAVNPYPVLQEAATSSE